MYHCPVLPPLSPLPKAICDQQPIPHLLQLIQEGADVNQLAPQEFYPISLFVFTIECYSKPPSHDLLMTPPKHRHHLLYLLQVLHLLLENGANPSCVFLFRDELIPFLHEDPTLLRHMIQCGLMINQPGKRGQTHLHLSIQHLRPWWREPQEIQKRLAVIDQLLEQGADPNFQDRQGYTALHHLLASPITPPLFELFQHILPLSIIHLEDNQGNTPLHIYVDRHGEYPIRTVPPYKVIDLLLSAGADPLTRNKQGDTPREQRQRNGHPTFPGLEEYLIEKEEAKVKSAEAYRL